MQPRTSSKGVREWFYFYFLQISRGFGFLHKWDVQKAVCVCVHFVITEKPSPKDNCLT